MNLCLSRNQRRVRAPRFAWAIAAAVTAMAATAPLLAQQPTTGPSDSGGVQIVPPSRVQTPIAAGLAGRNVERVEVRGNKDVTTGTILNVIRTKVGTPLDPATVQDDYQRIYELRRFANVEAQTQPTANGVIVAFIVTEQRAIRSIRFRGNSAVDTATLQNSLTLRSREAIDNFRIALAKNAIEQAYRSKNYPLVSVSIDNDALSQSGDLIFIINEGPNVRVRNIDFIGNATFSEDKLKSKIQSRAYVWILRSGTLDENQLDDDIASLREFYRSKGFFDCRVGRRVLFSADQSEAQLEFLIDEGPRYKIEKLTFVGNEHVTEARLRQELKLVEGEYFDQELLDRDQRKLVDAFAPLGVIYEPTANDPNYLSITPQQRFRLQPGAIELVYRINEGKPFHLGNIEVRGNTRTKDKVILRELTRQEFGPGDLFNASAIRDSTTRLKGLGLFDQVKMTPIGEGEDERDLLVEVQEAKTATLTFGAGINSNGGLSGTATYTQRNFDITNWPNSFSDVFDESAFVGAGQNLRISLEPGTEATNASIRFTEPWLLDQPYSLTTEAFLRDRRREHYDDNRIGGRVTLGRRFTNTWSGSIGLRGELVDISNIEDEPVRAFEFLEEQGTNTLTSTILSLRRDTTNPGPLPYQGSNFQVAAEFAGTLGGDYSFQKYTTSWDNYYTLSQDLLDRRTILALHADGGYITGDAPFFERFYGGGIGSVRGFRFRGITPRSGPDDDRVGGEFSLTGTAEVSFPVATDQLRGVVFTDVGTVESDFELGTIRSAVGFGVRLTLPIVGEVPIALDFAYPLTKDDKDDTQIISFSLGFVP